MSPPAIKIELVGLWGSGKSTVASLVAEQLNVPSVVYDETRLRHRVFRHPVLAAKALGRMARGAFFWSDKQALFDFCLLWFHTQATFAEHQSVILSEGILHRVAGEVAIRPTLKSEPWRKFTSGSHLRIMISVTPEIAVSRIRAKSGPVSARNIKMVGVCPSDQRWLQVWCDYSHVVHNSSTVIWVDGANHPVDIAAEIVQQIRKVL